MNTNIKWDTMFPVSLCTYDTDFATCSQLARKGCVLRRARMLRYRQGPRSNQGTMGLAHEQSPPQESGGCNGGPSPPAVLLTFSPPHFIKQIYLCRRIFV